MSAPRSRGFVFSGVPLLVSDPEAAVAGRSFEAIIPRDQLARLGASTVERTAVLREVGALLPGQEADLARAIQAAFDLVIL